MIPLPRQHASAGRHRSLFVHGFCIVGLGLLTAGCVDTPVHVPAPETGPQAQGSPGGFRQEYLFPLPATSEWPGALRSTQTPIVIPRDGTYRLRVQGQVTLSFNPAYPGPCGTPGSTPPPQPLGTYGPFGTRNQWGQVVMKARVNTEPIGFYGYSLGFSEVDAQTMDTEVNLAAGQQLWVDWTGYPGTVWCGATVPYYLFSGSLTLTVTELAAEQHTLVVECNGARGNVSVQRGTPVTCEAKTEPVGGEVSGASWSFADTRGQATVAGPVGQNTWGGPMVVGGTVSLSASVNGTAQTATAAVNVTPRPWRDIVPGHGTVHCPGAGVADCPLNAPPRYDKDVGQTKISWRAYWNRGARITGGPNTGWYYLRGSTGVVEFFRFTTYLHSELLNPSSSLFRGGCTQSGVTTWITQHEDVHVRKIRRGIERQELNPELETLAAFGEPAYRRARDRAEARVRRMTRTLGDPDHSDNDYPPNPCELHLLPNP